MKATIIVVVVLCLVVGGIAGWALRGVTGCTKASVAMVNITPESYHESQSRIAVYDGRDLAVAEYNLTGALGSVKVFASVKTK